MLAIVAGSFAFPAGAQTPSLEGIWETNRAASQILPEDPKFTAEGRQALDNHDPNTDPALFCIEYIPRLMISWGRKPMEILQSESQLWIMFERMHQVRRIYLDDRQPPEDEAPTWMGHSNGRWVDGSLVVETTNMRAPIFHWSGLPMSGEARVIERFTRLDEENLEVLITVIDPVNYSEPWTTRNMWRLAPDTHFYEYECDIDVE